MAYRTDALLNGSCQVSGHHMLYGGDPNARHEFPLIVWLLRRAEGPILVDTGLGDVDEMNRGAAHVLAEPIVQIPEQEIRQQLLRFDVRTEDVRWVFLTHLHFDHVDQLDL